MPFVRPVTTIGLDEPVAVTPPGDAVTTYELIGAPPSDTGGVKLTDAWPFPATAVAAVGGSGAASTISSRGPPAPVRKLWVTERGAALPAAPPSIIAAVSASATPASALPGLRERRATARRRT